MRYIYIFVFLSSSITAQTAFELAYNAPYHHFQALDVKQTSDEGFLALSAVSNTVDLFYTKANVIKLSKNGDIEWSKNYDFGTNIQRSGDLVLLEKDSFAFLIGDANDGINKIITKATPNGIVVWSKNLGNAEFNSNGVKILSLATNLDKNTLGIFDLQGERPLTEIFGAKMDKSGNLLWAKRYQPLEFGAFELKSRIAVSSSQDGGYILTGNVSHVSTHSDALLIRLDSIGAVIWAKSYGNTSNFVQEIGISVIQTPDLGYIIAGLNSSPNNSLYDLDGFLMKTDSMGEVVWVNLINVDANITTECKLTDILLTENETVIVSGISVNAQERIKSILLEFDQDGNLLNHHKYPKKLKFSQTAGLEVTTDGGSVLLNSTKDSLGNRALYVIKTDETGDSGCSDTFPIEITRFDTLPTKTLMLTSIDSDTIIERTPIVTDFNDLNPPMVTPPPTVDIQIKLNEMCTNDTAIISFTGTNFFKSEWSNGVVNQNQIVVTAEGNYAISVTGCGQTSAEIEIDCEYPFDECIAIPNAFTPNGDNINDRFAPVVFAECERGIEIKEIIIWSRWGKKIFTGNSPDAFWDGGFQDNVMPADVYYYWIRAENREMEEMVFKGDVTLIR